MRILYTSRSEWLSKRSLKNIKVPLYRLEIKKFLIGANFLERTTLGSICSVRQDLEDLVFITSNGKKTNHYRALIAMLTKRMILISCMVYKHHWMVER